ncbi:MAG: N-acetyltransferase [Selenomonadaceae bacterium]|nr:N-acetyltransferase [Selenomonadaceae bacterium]MBQ6131756.1 N-acetyltransferase [Selenomonadaceae bacterium]
MSYRKATFADVDEIYDLIAGYAAQGVMLPKPHSVLYETLREFVVAEEVESKKIVGVGALHLTWNELAEVRSMAVDKNFSRQGIGSSIVKKLLEEGRTVGVKKFFTLTYRPEFFKSLGFELTTKESLPHKIWKDCMDCPKFPNCDEIAMTLE